MKNVAKNRDLIRYMVKGKSEMEMQTFIELREQRDKLMRDKERVAKQVRYDICWLFCKFQKLQVLHCFRRKKKKGRNRSKSREK